MFIEWLKGRAIFQKRKIFSSLIAISGVAIVIGGELLVFNRNIFIGDMIILGATLSWAFYTAYGKPMVLKYGPFTVTFLSWQVRSLSIHRLDFLM